MVLPAPGRERPGTCRRGSPAGRAGGARGTGDGRAASHLALSLRRSRGPASPGQPGRRLRAPTRHGHAAPPVPPTQAGSDRCARLQQHADSGAGRSIRARDRDRAVPAPGCLHPVPQPELRARDRRRRQPRPAAVAVHLHDTSPQARAAREQHRAFDRLHGRRKQHTFRSDAGDRHRGRLALVGEHHQSQPRERERDAGRGDPRRRHCAGLADVGHTACRLALRVRSAAEAGRRPGLLPRAVRVDATAGGQHDQRLAASCRHHLRLHQVSRCSVRR